MLEGIINDKEEDNKSSVLEKDENTSPSADLDKKYAVNNFEEPLESKLGNFEKTFSDIKSDFDKKLFDLKESIQNERNAIVKEKEKATEEFLNNTEAGKYIANQDTLHEYARQRELDTMEGEKEKSEELKGYKQNAMQFIREKFASDPVAGAYVEKQAEYNRALVDLDNLDRQLKN